MTEGDDPKIERFLQGKMSDTEKQAFQEDMGSDAALADEVSFRSDLAKAIRRKKLISQVHAEFKADDFFKKEETKTAKTVPLRASNNKFLLRMAAAVVLLILAGSFWYANTSYSNAQLAQIPFDNIRALGLTEGNRGGDPVELTRLKEATVELDQGNFAASLGQLSSVPDSDPNYAVSQLYRGYALFQMQDYDEAIPILRGIIAGETDNIVKQKAEWVLLNCLLEQNDLAVEFSRLLNEILANKGHQFYRQSLTLKEKLDSGWRILVF